MQSGLHSHLLCGLFDGMPDLCGVEGDSVFWLVKIFCLLFSSSNYENFEIGKAVLKVGKMPFLLYGEEGSEVFLALIAG